MPLLEIHLKTNISKHFFPVIKSYREVLDTVAVIVAFIFIWDKKHNPFPSQLSDGSYFKHSSVIANWIYWKYKIKVNKLIYQRSTSISRILKRQHPDKWQCPDPDTYPTPPRSLFHFLPPAQVVSLCLLRQTEGLWWIPQTNRKHEVWEEEFRLASSFWQLGEGLPGERWVQGVKMWADNGLL